MTMPRLLVALLACIASVAPAAADFRIVASPGGPVIPYIKLFETVAQSGERVIIDGPCMSACTLVLTMVPRQRICVTPRAVLGFHAARSFDAAGRSYAEPEATRVVLDAYPPPVRQWIRQRGGLTSRVLLLRGRELAAIYPACRTLLPGSGTRAAVQPRAPTSIGLPHR